MLWKTGNIVKVCQLDTHQQHCTGIRIKLISEKCVGCLGLGIWQKGQVVSVHDMKAYRGSEGLAPLILNQQQMEVSGHPHALVTLLLGERGPCSQ